MALKTPIDFNGKLSTKDIMEIQGTFEKYNHDYDYMLANNIITKRTFLKELTYFLHVDIDKLDVVKNDEIVDESKIHLWSKNFKIVDSNWKTKPRRNIKMYRAWRENVLKRDNYKCVECGKTRTLHVHHIKPFKNNVTERYDLDNGKTVCAKCHKKEHKKGGTT